MPYRPFPQREPDAQYQQVICQIVHQGIRSATRQGVDCLSLPQPALMHFDLNNGFPVIPDRSIRSFWRKPIDELFAFINGVHLEPELREQWGVNWWGEWATESKTAKRGFVPGDIGPRGSYGPAFHDYPTTDGLPFDQFLELVEQIKRYPDERRHMVTNWLPPLVFRTRNPDSEVTIAPCHGSLVYVRILGGELYLRMVQRSGDVPVGVPANMVQYAALTLAIAHLTGFPARGYSHVILDPHIYTDQISAVNQLMVREPRRLPTVTLSEAGRAITDIHDFRGHHFELTDYDPHPAISGIPVAT